MSLARRRAAAQKRANEPNFVAWYSVYPKKVAAADALKAWEQTEVDRPPLGEMLATLEWQIATDFGKRPYDKIPYPATYLRKGQYKDQRPPTNGHAKPAAPPPPHLCRYHLRSEAANRPAKAHDADCAECRHVAALMRPRNGESEPTAIGDLFSGGK